MDIKIARGENCAHIFGVGRMLEKFSERYFEELLAQKNRKFFFLGRENKLIFGRGAYF